MEICRIVSVVYCGSQTEYKSACHAVAKRKNLNITVQKQQQKQEDVFTGYSYKLEILKRK